MVKTRGVRAKQASSNRKSTDTAAHHCADNSAADANAESQYIQINTDALEEIYEDASFTVPNIPKDSKHIIKANKAVGTGHARIHHSISQPIKNTASLSTHTHDMGPPPAQLLDLAVAPEAEPLLEREHRRSKRVASQMAEIKYKRLLEREKDPAAEQEDVSQAASLFCKIPIRKRSAIHSTIPLALQNGPDCLKHSRMLSIHPAYTDSPLLKKVLKSEQVNQGEDIIKLVHSPAHKSFIPRFTLKDITNSPVKQLLKTTNGQENKPDDTVNSVKPDGKEEHTEKADTADSCSLRSKFFLGDLDFLKGQKKARGEKIKRSEKLYLKQRKRNTSHNTGYRTVCTRKKLVVGIYNCSKAVYRDIKRERLVKFDLQNTVSIHHNGTDTPCPILIGEPRAEQPSFEWTEEKKPVDIIKRLDMGSEISLEEFVFKKVDREIEL